MQTKLRVPTRSRTVTVILVDARGVPTKRIFRANMQFPLPLCKEGQRARFPIPEFKKAPEGVVCDVEPTALTIVFPFVDPEDAQHITTKNILSMDEIVDLFQKFEPRLKEVKA
jgi:hypothetical protein